MSGSLSPESKVKKRGQHLRSAAYQQNCQTIAFVKATPCKDCGNKFPVCCMDFDHRPGEIKLHVIATLKSRKPEILNAEIAKCDVVCSNCHRIRSEKRGWGKGRPRLLSA